MNVVHSHISNVVLCVMNASIWKIALSLNLNLAEEGKHFMM